MKTYKYSYREGMSCGNTGIINANSPSDAAYRIAKMLGYRGKQVLNGKTYNYIIECGEFDGAVPLCIAVKLMSNDSGSMRYYAVRG